MGKRKRDGVKMIERDNEEDLENIGLKIIYIYI